MTFQNYHWNIIQKKYISENSKDFFINLSIEDSSNSFFHQKKKFEVQSNKTFSIIEEFSNSFFIKTRNLHISWIKTFWSIESRLFRQFRILLTLPFIKTSNKFNRILTSPIKDSFVRILKEPKDQTIQDISTNWGFLKQNPSSKQETYRPIKSRHHQLRILLTVSLIEKINSFRILLIVP